jgi:hypothetical protein
VQHQREWMHCGGVSRPAARLERTEAGEDVPAGNSILIAI